MSAVAVALLWSTAISIQLPETSERIGRALRLSCEILRNLLMPETFLRELAKAEIFMRPCENL